MTKFDLDVDELHAPVELVRHQQYRLVEALEGLLELAEIMLDASSEAKVLGRRGDGPSRQQARQGPLQKRPATLARLGDELGRRLNQQLGLIRKDLIKCPTDSKNRATTPKNLLEPVIRELQRMSPTLPGQFLLPIVQFGEAATVPDTRVGRGKHLRPLQVGNTRVSSIELLRGFGQFHLNLGAHGTKISRPNEASQSGQ